ncbi:MAG: aminopeptidase [Spirochaetaceae bacterium]|jgi:predicted aminopeptidase|nr:aminopeptidase [Spirochaetaceae bacterium]
MKTFFLAAAPVVSVIVLCVFAFLFSACYALKQGSYMMGYLSKAVPLEKLTSGGDADEKTALFINRVNDIRFFAMNDLGLKDTKNYTKYVDIDRDYLAAVVSACEKDRFETYLWWFPVVGKMPYKGFFNLKDARKEAEKLQNKDKDVWVRGVDAFSTLGYFNDPLYSYMRDYSEYRLAELLIHELFHATVFIKNNVQFNEETAEFTGRTGARMYIEKKYGKNAPQLAEIEESQKDYDVFVLFIQKLKLDLEEVYKKDISLNEKLEQKEAVIKAAQKKFEEEYDATFKTKNYVNFSKIQINNAYLQLYSLYNDGADYLEKLYNSSGKDLRFFIEAAKKIKGKSSPQKQLEYFLSR